MVDWNAISLAILGFGFFVLLGIVYYIDYLKSKDQKEKRIDPVSKALILTFLVSGLLFLAEAFGFFDDGWNQRNFWVHLIFFTLFFTAFMIVARRKNPLPFRKQKSLALNYAIEEYGGEEYIGDADISLLKIYKVTKEGDRDETRGEVGNFIVELKTATLKKIWIQINIFTGVLLHLQENPPGILQSRLLGQTPAINRDNILDEFDESQKGENNT